MSTVVKVLLSSIVAVISGLLSWCFGVEGVFNLIVSLLLFVVTLLVVEVTSSGITLKEIEKLNNMSLQIIKALFKNGTVFSDFYNILLLSDMRNSIRRGDIIVSRENVPAFWSKIIAHFDKSFFATSYINPDEGWTLAYTEVAQTIQAERAQQGKLVRRVFIVETDQELENVIHNIRDQRTEGIDAKYIFRKEIQEHRILGKVKLESLDFSLIDDEFLSIIVLDKNRKISHLRLTPSKELYNKYFNFYSLLFDEAKVPYNDQS